MAGVSWQRFCGRRIGGGIVSAFYEIELRYGERSEVRPYSGPLTEGERIVLDGSPWHVLRAVRFLDNRARTRYVCVPLRARARSR
jgi:hypothetical protein